MLAIMSFYHNYQWREEELKVKATEDVGKRVVKKKLTKLYITAFIAVVMTGVALFAVYKGYEEDRLLALIVAFIGAVGFAMISLLVIRQMMTDRYLLVVDGQGFHDFSSPNSPRYVTIEWDNVISVSLKTIIDQPILAVVLKDDKVLFDEMTSAQKKAAEANSGMGFGAVAINCKLAKDATPEELLDLFNHYLKERVEQVKEN